MSDVYLGKSRVRLDPTRMLGKGGEAEVYAVDPGLALKIWKGPQHADLVGQPAQQAAATARLDEQQQKLRAFPRGLPPEVMAPLEACTDRKQRVVGYAMKRVDAEPLACWADPAARRARSANDAVTIFRRLHALVTAVHRAGVVIGDFNDLNVLVRERSPYLIDVDSWQYGAWRAQVFTERFVDPTLCDASGMVRPYGADADWYAFAALLFQSLLCVGPWGGVHKQITPAARSLQRIWVLDAAVKYPRPAIDPRALPDALLAAFEAIFVRDQRGAFDDTELHGLLFARCRSCGLEHARRSCPACTVVVPVVTVRGNARARVVFATDGVIVHARLHHALHVVHYAEGAYRNETGAVLLRGPLDPRNEALHAPIANSRHRYWCADGRLYRDGTLGDELIGDVLAGQTRIFVGERFGLGLYRAGARTVAFLFDASRRGINDSLVLPRLPGQLVDVRACFDETRVWLFLSHAHAAGLPRAHGTRGTQWMAGTLEHHALVYDRAGTLLGSDAARAYDGTWLDSHGKVAVAGALLVATDEGLCRIEVQHGALVRTREFPDTEPFVDAQSELLVGASGLHVVSPRRIAVLSIG